MVNQGDGCKFPSLKLEKYERMLCMRRVLKIAAVSIAAALFAISTPQAGAFTNLYPTTPDFTGRSAYHFDDGKPSLSVVIPEGDQLNDGAQIMGHNPIDGLLHCTYWFGAEPAVRAAYDVVLYGDPADAVEHSRKIQEVLQGQPFDVRKFYVTHYGSGMRWAETVQYGMNLQGNPLAVLTDCSTDVFSDEKSFNYIVVDEQGDKIPELIPDSASIRAGLNFSKPALPLGGSSFGSS